MLFRQPGPAQIVLKPGVLPDTAITFNQMWSSPISWEKALAHLALVGSAEANSVNTPSWSLVYELRISLLIPALCFFVSRSVFFFSAVSVAIYILVQLTLWRFGSSLIPYDAEGILNNLLVTTHFAACFVGGVLLARAAINRSDWVYKMPSNIKIPIGLVGVALLFVFRDETCTVGSTIVILLALNTTSFQRLLKYPVLRWLGKISFSLYLTHTIVLQIVVRLLHGHVPLWFSLVVALIMVFPVAALFYQLAERPALRLSKWIGKRGETPVVHEIIQGNGGYVVERGYVAAPGEGWQSH